MLSFYLFQRYFFSRRSASLIKIIAWICLGGLTVSVAALILIISVMGGFGEAIKGRILSEEAHLVVNFENSPFLPAESLPSESLPPESLKRPSSLSQKPGGPVSEPAPSVPGGSQADGQKSLWPGRSGRGAGAPNRPPGGAVKQSQSFMPQMTEEQKSGIKEIVFFESQDLIIKSRLGFQGAEARGYSGELFHKMRERPVLPGQEGGHSYLEGRPGGRAPPAPEKSAPSASRGPGPWLNLGSGSESSQGAGPGARLAERPNNSSREILAGPELFMEMGIQESERVSLIPLGSLLFPPSLAPPVKKAAALPLAPQAGRPQSAEGFLIFYRQGGLDFGSFSKIRHGAEIKLHDPSLYPLYKKIFKDFGAESWADRNSTLFFALKLEKFIMTLFIALAFVISCFGISSALFLLSAQKAKDLGMLHAMGLSKKKLIKTFSRMGFCLSLLGIFAGVLTGALITFFLKYSQMNILPKGYQDRAIPAIFDPAGYLMIAAGAVALAWMACYFPARRLSQAPPAELLKITGR